MSTNRIQVQIQAIDDASAQIQKVRDSLIGLGNSGKGLFNISGMLSGMLSDIASSAIGFANAQIAMAGFSNSVNLVKEAFIDYNAQMEQAKVSFETLLKSADGAAFFIKQLQKLSEETPFDFPGVQQAAKQMLAYGFAARDVVPYLRTLSDAAAGLSMQSDGISRIVTQIGQIRAKGQLDSTDIKPLTEMGIGVEAILREKFGKSIEEINKSKTSIEEIIKALMDGIDKEFGGLSAKQAKTFTGLMSTLKDQTAYVAGAIGEPFFITFKNILVETGEWVGKLKSKINEAGMKKVFEEMVSPDVYKSIGNVYNSVYYLTAEIKKMAKETLFAKDTFIIFATALDSVAYSFTIVKNIAILVVEQIKHLTASVSDFLATTRDSFEIFKKLYNVGTAGPEKTAPLFTMPDISTKDVVPPVIQLQVGIGKQAIEKTVAKWKELSSKITPWDMLNANLSRPDKEAEKRGEDIVNAHKGKTPGTGKSTTSGGADAKIDRTINRLSESFADLNQKIMSETATTYELGFQKISDEIAKIQREIMEKAAAAGLDTSAMQAKVSEYQKIMTTKLKDEQILAFNELRNETAIISAKLINDKRTQAEAEYRIEVDKLAKERDERFKAVALSRGDAEAKLAVDKWYAKQSELLVKILNEKKRDAESEKLSMLIESNQLEVDLGWKAQEETDRINRAEMLSHRASLIEQLKDTKLNAEERLKIKRELADIKEALPSTTASGGFFKGLEETAKSFGTWAQNMEEVGRQTAMSMQSSFQEFFFDAMTGQLKSLGDYINSFLKGVARAISNALANAFAQKLIGSLFGNILPGKADGGPVYSGAPYIVGERGPELFVPSASGTIVPNHALKSASNSAPTVIVNVQNNLGVKAEVKQETKFDGQRFIVGVVLDAYTRNIGGMRTVMAGARG